MFSYLRKGKDKDYVVILNFSPNTYTHEVFRRRFQRHVPRDHQYGVGSASAGTLAEQPQHCHAARVSRNGKPYMIEADVPAFGGVMLEVEKSE